MMDASSRSEDVFMNILMWWEDFEGKVPTPVILKPSKLLTGKQVFYLIIPTQIKLLRYFVWNNDSEKGYITLGDAQVRIEKGELLSGTRCKKTLGTSTKEITYRTGSFRCPSCISGEVTRDRVRLMKVYSSKKLEKHCQNLFDTMSGRAGCCGKDGKDERGICIVMIDEKMKMNSIKDMMLGKLAPLVSTFRLNYYTILNLLIHAQGQFTAEHVIKNSFHQLQYEKALPDSGKKVFKLEEEAAKLDALGEVEVAEYDKLKLEIAQQDSVFSRCYVTAVGIHSLKPLFSSWIPCNGIFCMLYITFVVKVREGGKDWGWGVVLSGKEASSCYRQSIMLAVQELQKRFPQGLPKLNPVKGFLSRSSPREQEHSSPKGLNPGREKSRASLRISSGTFKNIRSLSRSSFKVQRHELQISSSIPVFRVYSESFSFEDDMIVAIFTIQLLDGVIWRHVPSTPYSIQLRLSD
ncbi:Protein HUA ENHANCER 2 [Capsicum chinense]|nr:Protein HUA ENHANCER 2 [Capsicum chinense]